MTIGPDNFGGGVPKNDDRFAAQLGQYRPGGRRDGGRTIAGEVAAELAGRNGSSVLDSRNGAGMLDSRNGAGAIDTTAPIASSIAAPKLTEQTVHESNPLTEQVFAPESWHDAATGTLADHPLLRGLLMELPPKGTVPPSEYLDRWFEAARSILDLLYAMNARS